MANGKVQLTIGGMHCANCAQRIEKTVGKMDGVNMITVNMATEKGSIAFDEKKISLAEIIDRINHLGFDAQMIANRRKQTEKSVSRLRRDFFISAVLTLPLAWAMLSHFQWTSHFYIPPLFLHPLFQCVLVFPIQFIIGFSFYERAYLAVKNGSTNMDVLVVLSTSAAFFYSHYVTFTMDLTLEEPVLFYETSAFIITFILLGKLIEASTKARTTESLTKLYEVQTKTANVWKNGKEIQMEVTQLMPGDIVMIKPGEKVPTDGKVVSGLSMVDESLLTGESIPVEKEEGALLYAGTINQNGMLHMEVTKKDAETVLSQIIRVVEEAQDSKAPIQHLADSITGFFVPIIIAIAVVTFLIWYIMLQPGNVNGAISKSIAVLIIACPCALGLATPTSIMVGSGRAAQAGILFKEGKFLELLGKSDVILLDKTGTVTSGKLEVTNVQIEQQKVKHFWELVGAVELSSHHPIAKAIVQYASKKVTTFPQASEVRYVPGYGIQAVVQERTVTIASPAYYKRQHMHLPVNVHEFIDKHRQVGKTVMIVYVNNQCSGVIAMNDQVKATSIQAVKDLKKGYDVCLVTGDHLQAALPIAKKIGVDHVYASRTPQQKVEIVKRWQRAGKKVMMIGDGINDAPSLAVADIGIALGTGSDIAIDSGDITIVKGDIKRVNDAIYLSKKTMTNIKQNIAWAFFYNMIMIPFAMIGIFVPWLAGAAMAFSSVTVVLNALRLKRVKIR